MKHLARPAAAVLVAVLLLSFCGERPGGKSVPAPADAVALESPYRQKARVYRGQLHAHTTNSDGRQSPAAVMIAYRDAGYDFAAITDHDFNTDDPGVPGILFIPGVENDHACLHENRINAATAAPGARLPQAVIDQALKEGSFVQINHPDWPGRFPANPCWSDAALLAASGYHAVEIWNASNDKWNSNAEPRIDMLLANGRRTNLTAVDDCHDVRAAYCMTSWVAVFADALTSGEIMANLKSGNFYASSGAAITSVSVYGPAVTVTVPTASDIAFIGAGGRMMRSENGVSSSSYEAVGGEKYIRVRVTRRPGPGMAWTNPIAVTRGPRCDGSAGPIRSCSTGSSPPSPAAK